MKEIDSLSERSRKRNATIIKNYGSLEAYKEAAKEWGKSGGQKSKPGLTFEQYSKAGKLGHAAMIQKMIKEAEDK